MQQPPMAALRCAIAAIAFIGVAGVQSPANADASGTSPAVVGNSSGSSTTRLQELQANLTNRTAALAEAQSDVSDAAAQVVELKREASQLQKDVAVTSRRINSLSGDKQALERTIDQVLGSKQVRTLRQKATELTHQKVVMEQTCAQKRSALEQRVKAAEAHAAEAEDKLDDAKEVLHLFREQNADLQKVTTELQEQARSLRRQAAKAISDKDSVDRSVSDVMKENRHLESLVHPPTPPPIPRQLGKRRDAPVSHSASPRSAVISSHSQHEATELTRRHLPSTRTTAANGSRSAPATNGAGAAQFAWRDNQPVIATPPHHEAADNVHAMGALSRISEYVARTQRQWDIQRITEPVPSAAAVPEEEEVAALPYPLSPSVADDSARAWLARADAHFTA